MIISSNFLRSFFFILTLFLICSVSRIEAQQYYDDYNASHKSKIFHDGFNDDRNDWYKGKNTSRGWIENGFYNFSRAFNDKEGYSFGTKKFDGWNQNQDFEIETRFRLVKGNTYLSSLLFGHLNGDKNWKFGMTGSGYYRIVEENEEWDTEKGYIKSSLINRGGFNKFTVRKVGTKIYYFLNEKLVHRNKYKDLFGKYVGFEVSRSSWMQIDYLTVSHLKKAPSTPDHQYSDYPSSEKTTILNDSFYSNSGKWSKNKSQDNFWIQDGHLYVQSTTDENAGVNIYPGVGNDQGIEIEASLQYVSGKEGNNYDLVFGYQNPKNFLQFSISGNGYYRISEMEDGLFRIHKNWTKSSLVKENAPTRLAVRMVGGQNYYFIDETLVYHEYAEPLYGHKVGFRAFKNSKMKVDYLKVHTLKDNRDIKTIISSNVQRRIRKWQTKGEFETTAAYQKRVTEEKREKLIQQFTQHVIDSIGVKRMELNIRRADYDADNQSFKLNFANGNFIYLEVPLSEARKFDQTVGAVTFRNPKFALDSQDDFVLKSANIINTATNKSYRYDISQQIAFNTSDLALNFDPIDVKVKTQDINENVREGRTKIEVGKADVDVNIPRTNMINSDAIAVVIGNRNYEGDTPNVDYAVNDAQIVKKYLVNTFGFKPGNILYEENATKTRLEVLLGDERIPGKLRNYVKPGKSDVFFFYSGHGAPDPNTKTGYLIPVDGDPTALSLSGYSLNVLYDNLAKVGAKSVQVIIDACFSGATGSGNMLVKNASPVGIEVRNPAMKLNNGLVITASSGSQVASWYPDKGHGLLTYFYLKGIRGEADLNNNRQITTKELQQYLLDATEGIPYWARRLHNREQTPEIISQTPSKVLVNY